MACNDHRRIYFPPSPISKETLATVLSQSFAFLIFSDILLFLPYRYHWIQAKVSIYCFHFTWLTPVQHQPSVQFLRRNKTPAFSSLAPWEIFTSWWSLFKGCQILQIKAKNTQFKFSLRLNNTFKVSISQALSDFSKIQISLGILCLLWQTTFSPCLYNLRPNMAISTILP